MLDQHLLQKALLKVASQVQNKVAREKLIKLAIISKKKKPEEELVKRTAFGGPELAEFVHAHICASVLNLVMVPFVTVAEDAKGQYPSPANLSHMTSKEGLKPFLAKFGFTPESFDGSYAKVRQQAWKIASKTETEIKAAMIGTGNYFTNWANPVTNAINDEISNDMFAKLAIAGPKLTKEFLTQFGSFVGTDSAAGYAVVGPIEGGRYTFLSDNPDFVQNKDKWMKKIQYIIEDVVFKVIPSAVHDIHVDMHKEALKDATDSLLGNENAYRRSQGLAPLAYNKDSLKYLIELGQGSTGKTTFKDPVNNKVIVVTTEELYYLAKDIKYKLAPPDFHPNLKFQYFLDVIYNPKGKNVDVTRLRVMRNAFGSQPSASLKISAMKPNPIYAPENAYGVNINAMKGEYLKQVKELFNVISFVPLQVKRSTGNNTIDLPFTMDLSVAEFRKACVDVTSHIFNMAVDSLEKDVTTLFETLKKSTQEGRTALQGHHDSYQGPDLSIGDIQQLLSGKRPETTITSTSAEAGPGVQDRASTQTSEVTIWKPVGMSVFSQPSTVHDSAVLLKLPNVLAAKLQMALEKLIATKRKPWNDAHNLATDTNLDQVDVLVIDPTTGEEVKNKAYQKFDVTELRAPQNATWSEILSRESGLTISGTFKDKPVEFFRFLVQMICEDIVVDAIAGSTRIASEYFNKQRQDLARSLDQTRNISQSPLSQSLDQPLVDDNDSAENPTGLLDILQDSSLSPEELLLKQDLIEKGLVQEDTVLHGLLQNTVANTGLIETFELFDKKVINHLTVGSRAVDIPDNVLFQLLSTCISASQQVTSNFLTLLYKSAKANGNTDNLTLGLLWYLTETFFKGASFYENSTTGAKSKDHEYTPEAKLIHDLRDLVRLMYSVSSNQAPPNIPGYTAILRNRNPILYMPLGTNPSLPDFAKPAMEPGKDKYVLTPAKFNEMVNHNKAITIKIRQVLKQLDLAGLDATSADTMVTSLEKMGITIHSTSSSFQSTVYSALKTNLKTVIGSMMSYASKIAPLQDIAKNSENAYDAMRKYSEYLLGTVKTLEADAQSLTKTFYNLDLRGQKTLSDLNLNKQELANYIRYKESIPKLHAEIEQKKKELEEENKQRASLPKPLAPKLLKVDTILAKIEAAEKFVHKIDSTLSGSNPDEIMKNLKSTFIDYRKKMLAIEETVAQLVNQIKRLAKITKTIPSKSNVVDEKSGGLSDHALLAMRASDPFLSKLSESEFGLFLSTLQDVLFKKLPLRRDTTLTDLGDNIKSFTETLIQQTYSVQSKLMPDFEGSTEELEDLEDSMSIALSHMSQDISATIEALKEVVTTGVAKDDLMLIGKTASAHSAMQRLASLLHNIKTFQNAPKTATTIGLTLRWGLFKAIKKEARSLGL